MKERVQAGVSWCDCFSNYSLEIESTFSGSVRDILKGSYKNLNYNSPIFLNIPARENLIPLNHEMKGTPFGQSLLV